MTVKYDFVCYYCMRAMGYEALSHYTDLDVTTPFGEYVPVCVGCVAQMLLAEKELEKDE